jgi:hypothetical protein
VVEKVPVIFLHVGPMKTGTTYLQHVLAANKPELEAAGYLFPGETWVRQLDAVRDVLRLGRRDPVLRRRSAGAWAELVAEMRSFPGAACVVSMEYLGFAGRTGATRVLRSLSPAEVHVVVTVRDAVPAAPSLWQTTVHNGSTVSWPRFEWTLRHSAWLHGPLGPLVRDRPSRAIRAAYGAPRLLDTWGRLVGSQRLHVVSVPARESAPWELWQRFASVVGVPPEVCTRPPSYLNRSLGYASTELLRRVNRAVGRLRVSDYNPTLKEQLALRILAARAGVEGRPWVDPATRAFGVAWNHRVRAAIQASGSSVTGRLEDLTDPPPGDVTGRDPGPPTDEELLAAAAAALEGLHALVRRRARRLGRTDRPSAGPVTPDRWDGSPHPVGAAVHEVAAEARTAVELWRRLRDR